MTAGVLRAIFLPVSEGPGVTEETTEKFQAIDRVEYHSALAAGLMIGRYRIMSVLGEGGFGITYLCNDTQLHRDVAIKEYLPSGLAIRQGGTEVLPRSTEASKDFVWGRSRFLDEARTMAKLSRVPAVVRVHDFLEAHGTAYVVMELLAGETLAQRLAREGTLGQADIERILQPLLEGLEQIHAVGFLHRDVKPANVMLAPDGAPTLIDFGASRAAVAGRSQLMTAVFTPGFAAPEQSSSGKQGPWTDIYGLAATLYACVTGKVPPSGIERLLDADTPLTIETAGGDFAPNLLAAINVGMLLQASVRPQSVEAWRQVLATGTWDLPEISARHPPRTQSVPNPVPTEAAPALKPSETPTPRPRRQPGPMVLAATALGLLLVAVGTGFAVFGLRFSPAPVGPQAAAPVQLAVPTAPAAPLVNQQTADLQAGDRRAANQEAEAQRLADEAAASERAQAAVVATTAAEDEARANVEPTETALKMTNHDRQKLQVALQSLGFDVGGIDGDFGPRSRQNIAAWQTKNGHVATGFVTAAQRATLLADGAAAIARWEDQQRRAWADEQRRLQLQQQTAPAKRGFRWPWQ
jgi:serine/threonine protein kinase